MSVLANYFVFMTFFPACVSLVLEVRTIGAVVAESLRRSQNELLHLTINLVRMLYSSPGKVVRVVPSGSWATLLVCWLRRRTNPTL